jgi:hypothetical protein
MKTRIISMLLLAAIFALPVQAQDADVEAEQTEDTEEVDESQDEGDIDATDLDDQGFTDTDDDFRPSEDISTDQSISFPTDI